ncbi:MAG TPA: NUDIX hydrolase [Gemmataceae bacterium]|nr:NUDIX hydrolase [Gemmataceae bacterium]
MTQPKKQYCYEYPRPSVTVDVVIVTREQNPRVLLIRRKHEPFAGMWAIPGGFLDMEETLEAGAARELLEETGIRAADLEQLHAFGDPGRDPRGRTVSVAYLARVDVDAVQPQAADDAAEVAWHDLTRPPPLAFDHEKILECARQRLKRTKGEGEC